ncbi:MAG: bifunctional hydroxymethylpyrimidine kinase/phosphomethylpyrimidine kinase [Pseudomonadota bacterium]
MPPRILIIAGSDPSGGAGIQADVKTVTALGGYAATAVTALTVQNTVGVSKVSPVSPDLIKAQILTVLEDIGADAIKIGMIGDTQAGAAIVSALGDRASTMPIVVDPVLAATSGDALAKDDVSAFILEQLTPLSAVITPNADEAAILTNSAIISTADQESAARSLVMVGAGAALVKGGHLEGSNVTDVLYNDDRITHYSNKRIITNAGHGTGCTLASAIATGLGNGMSVQQATENAIAYLRGALETAPGFGKGTGPLNHSYRVSPNS